MLPQAPNGIIMHQLFRPEKCRESFFVFQPDEISSNVVKKCINTLPFFLTVLQWVYTLSEESFLFLHTCVFTRYLGYIHSTTELLEIKEKYLAGE